MAAVAELIEISFAGELDASSRRMVREMKAFGRAGWIGWLVGRLFLPPAAYPRGFVWQEKDQLAGNASLMPVAAGADRWVLANVAVHPEFRRRGIARLLVLNCMDLARKEGAKEIVLQVRHDNQGAIDLYRELGFELLSTRTEWQRRSGRLTGAIHTETIVRRARSEEWKLLWRLAQDLFPEGVRWPYALNRGWFEISTLPGLLSPTRKRSWIALDAQGQPVAGALARLSPDSQGWQLILLAPLSLRGAADEALLKHAVRQMGGTGLSFSLSYPPDLIDEALHQLGFKPGRTLSWMKISFA